MNLFFGKKKVEDIRPKIIETIKLINDTIETQQKRKKYIDKQVDECFKQAKEFVRINKKEQALSCLKKKKMLEKEIKLIEDSIFNLDVQKINLENSQLQKASFEVFARVNSVMKEASIKTEDVENVMDDLQDAVDQQNEISEALSRPLIHIDVEDELEMLMIDEKEKEVQINYNLPSVPVHDMKIKKKEEELKELEELKREMLF